MSTFSIVSNHSLKRTYNNLFIIINFILLLNIYNHIISMIHVFSMCIFIAIYVDIYVYILFLIALDMFQPVEQ